MTIKLPDDWNKTPDSTSFFGLNLAVFCYRIGGWPLVNTIIFFITLGIYIFNGRTRKISKEYGVRLKDFSKKKIKFSPFWHIFRFCQALMEKILAWKGLIPIETLKSCNDAHNRMLKVASSNQGILLLGSHIGNMEMLRALNGVFDKKQVHIIMQVANSQRFIAYLNSVNKDSNLNIIPANEINPTTIFKLSEYVRRGDWVVMMADRLLNQETRKVEVNFLGAKSYLPQGPWIIASLLGVPVYTVFNAKQGNSSLLFFNEWGKITLSSGHRDDQIAKLAQKFAGEMEDILLQAPKEWFNFYSYWIEDKS